MILQGFLTVFETFGRRPVVNFCGLYLAVACLTACQEQAPELNTDNALPSTINITLQSPDGTSQTTLLEFSQSTLAAADHIVLNITQDMEGWGSLSLVSQGMAQMHESFYRPHLAGICRDPAKQSPVFLVQSKDEGIGIYYYNMFAKDPQQQWQNSYLASSTEPLNMAPYLDCQPDQTTDWHLAPNSPSQACNCVLSANELAQSEQQQWYQVLPDKLDTANPLPADFKVGKPVKLSLHPLAEQATINELIHRADTHSAYQMQRYASAESELVNIVLEQGVYENLGLTFIRHNKQWYLWLMAGVSSKGFHPVQAIHPTVNNKLVMNMCISDCDWWGKRAQVELDLAQLTVTYLSEAEPETEQ